MTRSTRSTAAAAAALVALLGLVAAGCGQARAEVVAYGGAEEFDAAVGALKPGQGVFVKWFAPWCGHCKRLAPTWKRLAADVAAQGADGTTIAHVDCTTDAGKELCAREGVRGYPTLKLYEGGGAETPYKGERSLLALKQFLASVSLYELSDADLPQPAFKPVTADEDASDALVNAALSAAMFAAGAAYLCWPRRKPVRVVEEPAEPIADVTSNAELDEVLRRQPPGVTVVDFHAEWCGPCKRVRPEIERLNQRERSVRFLAADVDVAKEVADRFRVRSMPTFLFFKGEDVVARVEGANVQAVVERLFFAKRQP